jgi:hypothetical protein
MNLPAWVSKIGLAQHAAVGLVACLVLGLLGSPPLAILVAVLAFAIWHEWTDGDLTVAPGAPWNGVLDVLAFVLVPVLWLVVHAVLS